MPKQLILPEKTAKFYFRTDTFTDAFRDAVLAASVATEVPQDTETEKFTTIEFRDAEYDEFLAYVKDATPMSEETKAYVKEVFEFALTGT